MREGWINCKLEEITTLVKRGISPKYVDENGVFVINQKCIRDNKVSYFDARLTSKEKKIPEEKFVQIGDTLINSTGTGTLGRTGYVKNVPNPTTVDTHVTIVRPNLNKVEARFLGLFLNFIEPYIENLGKGATNQIELSAKDLSKTQINLPPLETQKKIASILSGYDDLIENNLKRIKILEEMAQQTYEEWFVRMRFPGHDASRASASLNPETGLPEGWKQCRMGEILNFTNGFAFKSKDYVENGVYSIVTIKNVQEGYFENSKFDKILEIPSKVKESQRLKTGDLVMSLTGNVGRLCFVYGENLLLNQRVCKIDSKAIGFVYCTLRSSYFKNKIENLANGAAQQNLSTIDMENLIIDFPKNELIDDFESFVNPIFNSILNLNIQNQRLREARDILLPRLMMGMIEV